MNELLTINVQDPTNCKPLKMIEIETKAKSYFMTTLEISNDEKKFNRNCLECYHAMVNHLKSKLPWESTLFKNAAFLDSRKKNCNGFLTVISSLTLQICKPLETFLSKVF